VIENLGRTEQYPDDFYEKYLPGLLQLAPAEIGLTQGVRYADVIMEPKDTGMWLEERGYKESLWAELLNKRIISHDVRASIITALSEQPRSLLVLKVNLRALDELDGLIEPMEGISDRVLYRTTWHTPALQDRLSQ
jgi:hypothetical protein